MAGLTSASVANRTLTTPTSNYEEPVSSDVVFRISTLTSPTVSDTNLRSTTVQGGLVVEAGMSSGVIARAAEQRKHYENDEKC